MAVAIGSALEVFTPDSDPPTVPEEVTAVEYIYPTSSREVTDNFEEHKARNSVNPGTDFSMPIGEPVHAVKAGTVSFVWHFFGGSGGRMVFINHADLASTEYLHLSRIDVVEGQDVQQGDVIGLSGASAGGREWAPGGPHLHISLKIDGGNVDFEKYVNRVP
jgi:murein DD-endopeptidase